MVITDSGLLFLGHPVYSPLLPTKTPQRCQMLISCLAMIVYTACVTFRYNLFRNVTNTFEIEHIKSSP